MKRFILAAALLLTPFTASARDISASTSSITPDSILAPGDYVWNSSLKTGDNVHVVVNLTTQMAYVWSGDQMIGATSVSSGRDGFDTPVGHFTVLGKEDLHWSKKYQAPMPWTMWLTTTGVALHSGSNPGRPSSHGCVHLPPAFAQLLYPAVGQTTQVDIIRQDVGVSLASVVGDLPQQ